MHCMSGVIAVGLLMLGTVVVAQEDEKAQRFKRFDQNGDGVLTPGELKNADLFKQLDRNGDGQISREEADQYQSPKPRPANQPAAEPAAPIVYQALAEPLRELDPVVVTGSTLPQLIGKPVEKVVAFRYDRGWRQVPVQIDQRFTTDLGRLRGGAGQKVFMSPVYADPALRTGLDPDPSLDADDELVFMFKDTGAQGEQQDPPGVVTGSRVELRVVDPLQKDKDSKSERYVYLFISSGELQPAAGKDYVNYTFKLLSGRTTGPGPNPEDSVVQTIRYRNHFSERWVHDATQITVGDSSSVDVLDRDEFLFRPGIPNRSTDTFSGGSGEFIANVDGPVRAIRSVCGCNSGTFSQRDLFFYEGQILVRTYFRVHPIGSTWCFYDFSPAANGMKYFDNLNPNGVTIDGSPDDVKTGPMDWQFVTGPQGSLTIAWTIDTDIPNLVRSSYYFDDTDGSGKICTGDAFAYGASGLATGDLPNTDPVLPTRIAVNRLTLDRTVYYDGPGFTVAQAKARITAAWFPLRVVTTSKQPAER